MATKNFDYETFAQNLAAQAKDLVPQDFTDAQKQQLQELKNSKYDDAKCNILDSDRSEQLIDCIQNVSQNLCNRPKEPSAVLGQYNIIQIILLNPWYTQS